MFKIHELDTIWSLVSNVANNKATYNFYLYKGQAQFEKLDMLSLPILEVEKIVASGKLYYENAK